ncbi:MAG: hypothetical protein ACRELX_16610, partial [Longimicrobiales bacterium]
DDGPWFTVVGVVRDVRHYGLDTPMRPGVYVPMGMATGRLGSFSIAVKGEADALSLGAPVRRIVRDLDPTIPLAAAGPWRNRSAARYSCARRARGRSRSSRGSRCCWPSAASTATRRISGAWAAVSSTFPAHRA